MSWWTNYPWRMVQTNLREIDMADMDAERFADDLAEFGATAVTLNAGGILAGYESRLPYHTVSSYLKGSSLRDILDACHKRNIRVIARMDFSKIPRAVYGEHPDWAFRTADGGIIEQNGFIQTCQNGEYQQEKALEILEELLRSHPFDGVYCNMSSFAAVGYDGRIYGMCCCDACREGFRKASGMEAPRGMDRKDPAVLRYMGFQAGAGKRLRMKMNAVVKAIDPEIALDKVDYLRTESNADIGNSVWVYSASSNSRQTAGGGRSRVSDNASVDFMGFRYRESAVSPHVMALRQWQNLANSGNLSLYVMGRLDNHRDRSGLEASRRVFRFHKEHEELLMGLTSGAEVLLVGKSQNGRSDPESYGWVRALTESHIPFDEAKAGELGSDALSGKRMLILADARDMTPEGAEAADAFAAAGGTVIVSGDSGVRGDVSGLKCLGIEKIREKKTDCMSTVFCLRKEEEPLFVRCVKSPVLAPGREIILADYSVDTQKYLYTEPEPPYGPPEICYASNSSEEPGLTVHAYGQGKGIFVPWRCGSFYYEEGYINTLNFIQDILFGFCGLPQIARGLHPSVELVLSKKEGKTVLSLINASGYFGNSFFEPVPMRDIELELPGAFANTVALNGGNVTLENENGSARIHLDVLREFEMIVLEERNA